MSKASLGFLLISAGLLAACVEEPPEPGECTSDMRESVEGELIEVVSFGGDLDLVCEASYETAERHAQWVADQWGEPPHPFSYAFFSSPSDPCWPCADWGSACAFPDAMAATELPERHEIAHAVREPGCSPLLEEGWAMLYGMPFRGAETAGDLREAADAIVEGRLAGEFYPFAARFAAFLLENYGLDAFRTLCGHSINSAPELDAALSEVIGLSIDEIEVQFGAYPEWTLGQLRQDLACDDLQDAILSPGTWTFDLQCGEPRVEGQTGIRLTATQLVEFPEAGAYVFSFDSGADFEIRLELRSCAREGMASIDYRTRHIYGKAGDTAEQLFDDMDAGVYVVRAMLQDSPEALSIEVGVESWL